jgi:hypothetical protein
MKINTANTKLDTSLNPSALDTTANVCGLMQNMIPSKFETVSKAKKLNGIFLLLKSWNSLIRSNIRMKTMIIVCKFMLAFFLEISVLISIGTLQLTLFLNETPFPIYVLPFEFVLL